MESPLEHLKDEYGSAIVGWVQAGVLYSRLADTISEELGARVAGRLVWILGEARSVHYFTDLSTITKARDGDDDSQDDVAGTVERDSAEHVCRSAVREKVARDDQEIAVAAGAKV